MFFLRSPTKNPILQNCVKIKYKKELSLILDCKTRWNSLVQILERFVYLKECIQKVLIDLATPIQTTDAELEVLDDIVKCLEPAKLTVLAVCK